MKRFYEVRFTVEGEGTFPFDMLRYDSACPATEADSAAIDRRGIRRINLRRFTLERRREGNKARWESFGWTILNTWEAE